jgi:hypothetical protein
MKKLIGLLTVLALLAIPVSAMAVKAGDWELVGYTKLETYWDSAQVNKNLSGPLVRDNAALPNHMGRWRFTAQSSRFGLKINGPEVLGAKTQGYIEIDFDSAQDARQSASNSWAPRMRHAWFRMDWPGGWQLLMGQYWGVFCDFYPETVNDGPLQNHGMATQRLPQVRLTYKTGPWTFSGLAGVPYDPAGDNATVAFADLVGSQASSSVGAFLGQRACMPQFQAQVIFEKDLYGKAGFAGRPRGFVADFGFGIQRTQYLGGRIANPLTWGDLFGIDTYQPIGGNYIIPGTQTVFPSRFLINKTQTLTPWVVQGTLFIPVLVTTTNNLANTASITIQAHIGQGFSFFGDGADGDNSFFKFDSPGQPIFTIGTSAANGLPTYTLRQTLNYKRHLTPKYGGYIQGQYYFSNQWHVSAVYGFDKSYGIPRDRNGSIPLLDPSNYNGYTYATTDDQSSFTQELQANLFWTPSKNLKFGLGYSFLQTVWFQRTNLAGPTGVLTALANQTYLGANWANLTSQSSRVGNNHSIRFGGWFFF